MGLDVALVASRKTDPCDPLQSGEGQTKSWGLELRTADVLLLWTLNVIATDLESMLQIVFYVLDFFFFFQMTQGHYA